MKVRNTFTSVLAVIALAVSIAITIAAWQTRKVQAIQDSEDRPNPFGFIELGPGQTARINVVVGNPNEIPGDTRSGNPLQAHRVRLGFDIYAPTDPPTISDPSCATRYHFVRRETCDVVLQPGHAASLDFTAVQGARIQPLVSSLSGPDTSPGDVQVTPEPHLNPTLEVREGARTMFVIPALVKAFNPQPDPPGQQP